MPNDLVFPGRPPRLAIGTLPQNVDLAFWQGDAQEYVFKLQTDEGQMDVTGFQPLMIMRPDFTSVAKYAFECSVVSGNMIRAYMPSSLSKTIPAGDYIWSLQLSYAGEGARTYAAGDVKVYAEVDGDHLAVDE